MKSVKRIGGSFSPWRGAAAMLATVVVAVVAAAGAQKQQLARQQAAMKAIQRAADVYAKCASFSEKWKGTFAMVIGGTAMPVHMKGDLVFKAPALLAASQENSRGSQSTVVVTADKFFLHSSDAKMSVSGPAPQAGDQQSLGALAQVASPPLPIGFAPCRFGQFAIGQVVTAAAGITVPSQWVKTIKQPENCDAYTVTMSKEGTVVPIVLWFDRQSGVLRQAAMELTREVLEGMNLAGEARQMPKGIGVRLLVSMVEVTVDGPVADEAFAYAVPDGYKQVAVHSAEEAFEKLTAATKKAEQQKGGQQGHERKRKSLEGNAPPDFAAKTLDGKDVKLSDLNGKPLVVDFWATWCPPCREEMVTLQEFHAALKDQGLQVVCVSLDRDPETVKKFLQEKGYTMTVWWVDPRGEAVKTLMEHYGLNAIPRTLYINKDFVVVRDTEGLHPREDMIKFLKEIGIEADNVPAG